ncbi:hypothetical protein QG053_11905, partial [Kingella kingae]|uniref:hypothetical protein n=1 Tax=Kingella kingae TaxID=504 RepID=UPI00254E9669
MKNLDVLTDFSLLLIERNGHWVLRLRYEILSPKKTQHERYLMSHRNKIKHWKILDLSLIHI